MHGTRICDSRMTASGPLLVETDAMGCGLRRSVEAEVMRGARNAQLSGRKMSSQCSSSLLDSSVKQRVFSL